MAARPTQLPEWATGAGATVVAPSAGKKALGWITDERPLAQYVNWILFTIYSWLGYLDSPVDQRRRTVAYNGSNAAASTWVFVAPSGVYHNTNAAHDWWLPVAGRSGETLRKCVGSLKPNGRPIEVSVVVYLSGTITFEASKTSTSGVPREDVTIDSTTVPTPTTGTWDHVLADGEFVMVRFRSTTGLSNQCWVDYADIYLNTNHQ